MKRECRNHFLHSLPKPNFENGYRIKLPTVSKPFPTRCIPWLALCAVHFAEKTGPKCPIKIPTTKTKAYFISNSFLDFVSGRSFVHFHTYKDSATLQVWQGKFSNIFLKNLRNGRNSSNYNSQNQNVIKMLHCYNFIRHRH